MTAEQVLQALRQAADLFHEIGGSVAAEKLLAEPRNAQHAIMGPMLRENLRTPDQIQRISADGFELCVRALAALGAPDVTIHECGAGALGPWGEGGEGDR